LLRYTAKQGGQTFYQADKVPQQAAMGKQTKEGCQDFTVFTASRVWLLSFCGQPSPVSRPADLTVPASPLAQPHGRVAHGHRTPTNSAPEKP
jgi:hypothetical protein